MNPLFKALGLALAVYSLFALWRGELWIKHRAGARRVQRANEPGYFAACIAIYLLLALALLTVF